MGVPAAAGTAVVIAGIVAGHHQELGVPDLFAPFINEGLEPLTLDVVLVFT